jgi:hypothetical protein
MKSIRRGVEFLRIEERMRTIIRGVEFWKKMMIRIIKSKVGFFKIKEDNKDHQKKCQILPNIKRQQGSSKEGSSSLKQQI